MPQMEPAQGTVTRPLVFVEELSFNDGTKIALTGNELVVLVGPNNAGKSAALRNIHQRFGGEGGSHPVISSIRIGRSATAQEGFDYLRAMGQDTGPNSIQLSEGHSNYGMSLQELNRVWSGELKQTTVDRFFIQYLRVEDRVRLADGCESFSSLTNAPTKAAHRIFLDESLEQSISRHFRAAFGSDFILNRGGGSRIEILCGERPKRDSGEEFYHRSYQEKLRALQHVSAQGDGMRCFAGVVMTALSAPFSVVLIDEPEAFLHPPQAVQLGHLLAEERPNATQFFIASHSSDVVRGVLNTPARQVKIVRLQRDGAVNRVRVMNNADVRTLWQDSLLRYSNLLDGLFHEKVVICEGDADCRFYGALFDALRGLEPQRRFPDMLFAPVFGKSRCRVALTAMRAIGVPTALALDFDALSDQAFLEPLVAGQGGNWSALEGDYRSVVAAINGRIVPNSPWPVRKEILLREVERLNNGDIPAAKQRELRELLDPPGPWREAKRLGENYLPAGELLGRWRRLQRQLDALGIFIVEAGELESWDRTVNASLHGPAWVEQALQKNLQTAPELENARAFVRRLSGLDEPPSLT